LSKHRSIEILIFVILYKFGDNLAQGLLRPFLVDMGYSATQRGVALGTIGLVATLSGTFVGGISTNILGLGHCLWLFGFLQVFSNIGYVFLAKTGVDLPLFYGAMAFETFTQGLGTGAFSVLLIRMTQKRFSATQYALFSSTFGLARVLAGPLSGFMVDALGWVQFFWASIGFGIPGLILLQRFSPLGERDPHIHVQAIQIKEKASKAQIVSRAWFGLLLGMLVTSFCMGCLNYAKAIRTDKSEILSLGDAILRVYMPQSSVDWIQTTGVISFALAIGLIFAAHKAARGQN
ncbi:MAG: MFS transporter, partial [Bdellovibrionales bacterium]|nr:MFS transporter [Bdellovibrionales bacterium]